jgi:hypothetical protein
VREREVVFALSDLVCGRSLNWPVAAADMESGVYYREDYIRGMICGYFNYQKLDDISGKSYF